MKLRQRQLSALLSILLLSLSLCQLPLLVLAAPTLNTEDGTFTAQAVWYGYAGGNEGSFGKTGVGGSHSNGGGGYKFSTNYAMAALSNKRLKSITIYLNAGEGGDGVKVAVFASSGQTVEPSALMWGSAAQQSQAGAQWLTFTIPTGSRPSLTAGAWYALAWKSDGASGAQFYYDAGTASSEHYNAEGYSSAWSNPFGSATASNPQWSIYATYENYFANVSTSTTYSHWWATNGANDTLRFDFSYSFPGSTSERWLTCTFPKGMGIVNITAVGDGVLTSGQYSVSSHNSTHNKITIPEATIASKGSSYKLFVSSTGFIYSITLDYVDNPPSRVMSFTCRLKDQNGNPLAQAVWVSVWDAGVEKSHVSGTSDAQGWYNSTITLPASPGTYYLRANTTAGVKQTTINVVVGNALTFEYGSGFVQLTQYKYSTLGTYRKSHVINSATGAGTNYQVKITVHYGSGSDSNGNVYTSSHCQTDFDDIRFTDNDGSTLLDYWLESKTDSDNAVFWVEVQDSLSSSATIYIYYGNPTASSLSNIDNTFVFGDEFSGSSLDTVKWPTYSGSISVSGGTVTLTNDARIGSANTYTGGYAFRARIKCGTDTSGLSWSGFLKTASASANSQMTAMFYDSAQTYFRFNSGDDTNYAFVDSGVARESSNYHTFEVRRTGSADRFVIDSDSEKTGIYPTNLARYVAFRAYTADLIADWVVVRKYVNPEPAHSTWGSETPLTPTSGSGSSTNNNYWAYTTANTSYRHSFSYSFPAGTFNRQLNCTFRKGQSIINLTETTGNTLVNPADYSVVQHNSTHMKVVIPEATLASKGNAYSLFTSSVSSVNSVLKDYSYNNPSRTLSFYVLLKDQNGNPLASTALWVSIWSSTAEISHVSGTSNAQGWYNSTISLPATVQAWNLRANSTGGVKYVSIYVTKVTVTLSVSDARINIATPASMPGTAVYSADSSYVPSGTVTINGNSSTITSGAYSYSPQYNTVGQRTPTVTAATDGGGCNSLTAQQSQNVVWDRIKILNMGVIDDRISISTTGKFWATAELEYDSHALGSGDSLTISGITMTWNATSSRFEGTDVQSSVGTITYSTFTSGTEATYVITAGTMNGFSESIGWDKARVYYQVLNDSTVTVGQAIEYRVKIILLLDGHALGSGDTVVANAGAMTWDAVNGWFYVTKVLNTVGNYTFSISSLLEDTYGIDAFEANVSDPLGTWEGWIVLTLSVTDDRIPTGDNASLPVAAEYGWNGTACSLSSITLNDTTIQAVPGTYGYTATAAEELVYHITNFTCNSVSVGFDRLVESDKGNNVTGTVHPGEWVREWFKVRSELDNAFMESGSLSINGSAATWDPGSNYWYLDVPVNWWNVAKSYVVTAATWDVYGIDTLNSGVATNSTGFTPTGWVAVTISFSRPRIDLGTNAITYLTVIQVYGWNSTPCSLTVYALNDTTTKGSLGEWGFKIASLTESAYSITNFTTNDISMIWEQVEGLLNLSGAVNHRVDAGSNATIMFPQLWYASDRTPFVGTPTLNDTTYKATPGRYGYEIASITDSLYNLTGFTTNTTYVIFDAMNVTSVTCGGFDSSGRLRLKANIASAFDGTPFPGYVDINGTKGQAGAWILVTWAGSGRLVLSGVNDTTYGLTRALVNKTWLVYLSEYRLTSEYNKTLSVFWYEESKMLQVTTASDVIQVVCPSPHAVTFNGFPKSPGDGWNYSNGVVTVVVPSSLSIGVWFKSPSSSGTESSGSDSSGGSTSATRVFLTAVLMSSHPQFSSDRLIEIRQYRIDNVALTEIDKAYIVIGLPLDVVMSLNVSQGEAELEEYNSTACMFLANDVRPTDDRSIVITMAAQLPGDAGKVINIGGFRMTYVQWLFFGLGIGIWLVLILLGKGAGLLIGFVAFVLIYFGGSGFAHVNPLMIDYSMTLPAIPGLDAAIASLDEYASSHLAEIGVFFVVAVVVLFLLRKIFGRKY